MLEVTSTPKSRRSSSKSLKSSRKAFLDVDGCTAVRRRAGRSGFKVLINVSWNWRFMNDFLPGIFPVDNLADTNRTRPYNSRGNERATVLFFFPAAIVMDLVAKTSRGGTPTYHVQLVVSLAALVAVMVTAVVLLATNVVPGPGCCWSVSVVLRNCVPMGITSGLPSIKVAFGYLYSTLLGGHIKSGHGKGNALTFVVTLQVVL